jgi:hypothetical protein
MIIATMKVGKAGIASATEIVDPITKIGTRFHFIPLVRIATTVVVIFIPATAVETAKMMIVARKAFMPGPA